MRAEEISPSQLSPAELDLVLDRHLSSRYLLEPPFASEPRMALVREHVVSAMEGATARTAVVRDDDTIVGLCVFSQHTWDSEYFGFPVGRVDVLAARDPLVALLLAEWTEACAREMGLRLASTRIEGTDLATINALEAVGYRFQEVTLVPWRDLTKWQPCGEGVCRPGVPDDVPALSEMARLMFRGRFHNDAGFDQHKADELYVKWVENWFGSPKPTKWSRVLELDGEAAGFIIYEAIDSPNLVAGPVGILVLGGIDPRRSERGLGARLWCDVIDDLATKARWASATMIAGNAPILNLYSKLGFKFSSTEITLHRWYG